MVVTNRSSTNKLTYIYPRIVSPIKFPRVIDRDTIVPSSQSPPEMRAPSRQPTEPENAEYISQSNAGTNIAPSDPWNMDTLSTGATNGFAISYLRYLEGYLSLKDAAAAVTHLHNKELNLASQLAIYHRQGTKQTVINEFVSLLSRVQAEIRSLYTQLLEFINDLKRRCSNVMQEQYANGLDESMSKAQLLMLMLIRKVKTFGSCIAELSYRQLERSRKNRGLPPVPLHRLFNPQFNEELKRDSLTHSGQTSSAFHPQFFPELREVFIDAGDLQGVSIAVGDPGEISMEEATLRDPNSTRNSPVANPNANVPRHPQFELSAGGGRDPEEPDDDDGPNNGPSPHIPRLPIPSGDPDPEGLPSPAHNSGANTLSNNGSIHGSVRLNRSPSHQLSPVPLEYNRHSTPARHFQSGLPDIPGLAGLAFQDDDEIWIDLMRRLDEKRGYLPDDVLNRASHSNAIAQVRTALTRGAENAQAKSILQMNNVKIDITTVTKYDGSSKVEDFEKFINQLLGFFKMTNLMGPDSVSNAHCI